MVPPLYLQIITVIGIVIILAVFFHYVPFFLWLFRQSIGRTRIIGTAFPDAHP